jgi:DNA-binding SARP family transcriptional activator
MGETLAIHLLEPQPRVVRSGQPQPPPRGRKVWALLAYLLITESAPSREWLSELLFSDADDPLNALNWNLTQRRRLHGPSRVSERTCRPKPAGPDPSAAA